MMEKPDFRELEPTYPVEDTKPYEIYFNLEGLTLDDEFDKFIKENQASKTQIIKIPRLDVNYSYINETLANARIFPNKKRLNDLRIGLTQAGSKLQWQLFANYWIDRDYYQSKGDKKKFIITKNSSSEPFNKNKKPELSHLFLNGMVGCFDGEKDERGLEDIKTSEDMYEFSETMIDKLANGPFSSIKFSNTGLIMCPEDYGLIASQTEKQTTNTIIPNISLVLLKQLTKPRDVVDKLLIFRYRTQMSSTSKKLKSPKVTWQVVDGKMQDHCDQIEAAKLLQTDNPPEVLDPSVNFEAWKHFMQIADRSLCYAMRET